jgi:hypothetical protein
VPAQASAKRVLIPYIPTLPLKRSHTEAIGPTSHNPFQDVFQDSKRRKIVKSVATASYVARFRKAINLFVGTCSICRVRGCRDKPYHELNQCPTLRPIMSPTEFITFARSIKYDKWHKHPICFRCHTPQVNDRLHATFDPKGTTCKFPDTIVAVAVQVLFNKNTKTEACDYFACHWPDVKAYLAWLNGPPSEGHYSRISELFLWFADISMQSTIRD